MLVVLLHLKEIITISTTTSLFLSLFTLIPINKQLRIICLQFYAFMNLLLVLTGEESVSVFSLPTLYSSGF